MNPSRLPFVHFINSIKNVLSNRIAFYALLLLVFAFNLSSHTFAFWPDDNWWLRSTYWLTYLMLDLGFIVGMYLLLRQLLPGWPKLMSYCVSLALSWIPFGLAIGMVDIATGRPFTSFSMGEWQQTGFISSLLPSMISNVLPRHLAFGSLIYLLHFHVNFHDKNREGIATTLSETPEIMADTTANKPMTPVNNLSDQATLYQAKFMQKLPEEKRSTPQLLQAQEHYLQVTTELGDELILYKFGQAISELPKDYGIQTHRSYWVARDNILGWSTTDNGIKAILRHGNEAPISRRFEQFIKPHFAEIT